MVGCGGWGKGDAPGGVFGGGATNRHTEEKVKKRKARSVRLDELRDELSSMKAESSSMAEWHASEGLRQRHALDEAKQGDANRKESVQDEITDTKDDPAAEAMGRSPSTVLGRTPDGRLFHVVETPDMVTSIFRLDRPKAPLDILTLVLLVWQVCLFCVLPRKQAQVFFAVYFAFWRIMYNVGLGFVLTKQSRSRWIVRMLDSSGWLDACKNPRMHAWIQYHFKTKLGASSQRIAAAPIDFQAWILFRSVVDVILLNDVTAYAFFALSNIQGLGEYGVLLFVVRWLLGLLLLAFNAWVKLDAHRVVKDYAWYWGDCFFLCLQKLKFDGVYEVAPDPMYSIGYIGYYGLSLLTGSYAVLYVSLAAHASQLLFLVLFENPHMDRVYGERVPIAARVSERRPSDAPPATGVQRSREEIRTSQLAGAASAASGSYATSERGTAAVPSPPCTNVHDLHHRLFRNDNVVLSHIDLFRSSDFLLVLCLIYALSPLVLTRCGPRALLLFATIHAVAWRLFHSFGLGFALRWQSEERWIVHHFLKHYHFADGQAAVTESFSHWKTIYNTSLIMTYVSFALLAIRSYTSWTDNIYRLRYVLGVLLILVHMWSARSSYRVLGPFGWLYGDFFIDAYPKRLSYTGIYRFLNNPERSMGSAAFFGMALLSGSLTATVVAMLAHLSHWWFLGCVEGPHMRRLYGADVRQDSGVTKQLRQLCQSQWLRAAQPSIEELQGILQRAQDVVRQLLEQSRPRLERLADDTCALLQQKAEHVLTMHTGDSVQQIDQAKYRVTPVASPHTHEQRFHVGEPIIVQWMAAENHSRRDWIGLYAVNALDAHPDEHHGSLLVTRTTSRGKWLGVAEDEWEGHVHVGLTQSPLGTHGVSSVDTDTHQVSGVSVFQGSRLPWAAPGTYELRYHHDNTHYVLAKSERFTIYADSPEDPYSFDETFMILSKILRYALVDAPSTTSAAAHEYESADKADLTLWTQDQAQHIRDGIWSAFHVDFTKDVVIASANTTLLTRDILMARQLLSR